MNSEQDYEAWLSLYESGYDWDDDAGESLCPSVHTSPERVRRADPDNGLASDEATVTAIRGAIFDRLQDGGSEVEAMTNERRRVEA